MDTGIVWGFDRWLGDNLTESLFVQHVSTTKGLAGCFRAKATPVPNHKHFPNVPFSQQYWYLRQYRETDTSAESAESSVRSLKDRR
jgi:hypothetical protein